MPRVFVINITSGEVVELTGGDVPFGASPTWSPDGKWIAFRNLSTDPEESNRIYLARPDGSDRKRLDIFGKSLNFRPGGH